MFGVAFLYSGGLWFLFIVDDRSGPLSSLGLGHHLYMGFWEDVVYILVACGSFLLWRFLPVGGVR